jgi:hypothetical protein
VDKKVKVRNQLKNNLALLINKMSSRSLAAARARRAGENAPPVSGNRPITSIGSQAAFVQPGYQTNMPQPPPNVRVGRGQQQNNAYQQVQQSQQQSKNGLPFQKLSVSDAIGLITLRLGRVEQWVIETEHENETKDYTGSGNIPENSRIIDNSILTTIINRIDSLEKKEPAGTSNSSEEITKLTEQLTRIGDEGVKHNLAIAKHTEQLFRFERELVETKDILKTFMIKYDLFASETNNRFTDFEYALADLEKVVQPPIETIEETNLSTEEMTGSSMNDIDTNNENGSIENISSIMSVDLKNIIKQELAASSN